MSAPPPIAERLLHALGMEHEYRDAILGDLAEEFAERAARDGVSAGRRWYYREAARTAPRLVGAWLRHLRFRDITDIAGVVFSPWVFLLILEIMVFGMGRSVADALGVRASPPAYAAWVLRHALPMIGGYLAAWLGKRAPLVYALAWGIAMPCISLALGVSLPLTKAVWWSWLAASFFVLLAATGGVLRVFVVARRPTGGSSSDAPALDERMP